MLVLSRNQNERVVVRTADGIEILVCLVEVRNGNCARIGFAAPPSVTIHREEVQRTIDEQRLDPLEGIGGAA